MLDKLGNAIVFSVGLTEGVIVGLSCGCKLSSVSPDDLRKALFIYT